MRCLPSLSSDETRWHLPLSASTAEWLAQLLIEPDCALCTDQAASRLRRDPVFALWTLCMANQAGDEPRTLEALACWLCDAIANRNASSPLLDWDAEGEDPNIATNPSEDAWRDEARRLTIAALHMADTAYRHATQTSHSQPDEVSLVALLHNYKQWFAIGGPDADTDNDPPVAAWLAREIADASRTADASLGSIASCLKAARHEVRQTAGGDEGTTSEACKDIWLEPISPWGRLLPRLAKRLARLDELEHRFDEQVEIEKLEAMAELAAGAGHEINNPLAVISGRAQLMLRDEHDPGRRRALGSIHGQALRVHEMISDLMLFARPPRMEPSTLDLAQLLDDLTTDLTALASPRRIRVTTVVHARPLWVEADPVQLTVALRAITDNAVEAIGEGGQIHIEARLLEPSADNSPEEMSRIEITIRDDGPGIAPDVRRHLFDPFYSGRSAGRGLGFGLTKCWRIVTAHGGQIDVATSSSSGTEFRVTLPASASRPILSGDMA